MKSYSVADIKDALDKLRIKKNDNLFIHSNLTLFGNCSDTTKLTDIPKLWGKSLINQVSNSGTIIFPLFTLSSCRNEIFNPKKSKTNSGALSECLQKNFKCVRTFDPIYSFGIIGNKKERIKRIIDIKNSFSKKSIFAYLLNNNFKILCLNHVGTTYLHFIERELKVNYRFDKEFEGRIIIKGKIKKTKTKIFVAYNSDKFITHSPERFSRDARKKKIIKSVKIGSGNIDVMSAKSLFNFVKKKIKTNHYYLTKASKIKNFKPKIIEESIFKKFVN